MAVEPIQLNILKLRRLALSTAMTRDADGHPLPRTAGEPFPFVSWLGEELPEYTHYPALLMSDGAPWHHGNLYLLSKIEASHHNGTVDAQTLMTIARELRLFMAEMNDAGLNYLEFPTRKLRRPTYYYAALLNRKVDAGEMGESTKEKKLGCVFGFYTWLRRQHDFSPENSLWDETTKIVSYLDDKGFEHQKVITKNSLRGSKSTIAKSSEDGTINDGGVLRPHTRKEQLNLINCLLQTGNTELQLMCLISLISGGRIQTVLTLRTHHIRRDAKENGTRKFALPVGRGTGIDTKKSKRHVLYIPEWLHYRLAVYIDSPRYLMRKNKASASVQENDYIFITNDGIPYYSAKDDAATADYTNIPKGDALRQTIRRELQPLLDQCPTPFKFRFHDLRATFGMNYAEDLWARINKDELSFISALNNLKDRMGHSKIETTLLYLNYRITSADLNVGYEAIETTLMESF
ncbi:site-specific integrase [Pseudomonas glycinae]|uniref:Integrase n=1 Tax=Pseudomonas glycinae TaxID=1785145 RepID=A0ABN4MJJ1_9PSED|nr:site-specific integrase [Pseudomonas glycinae]AMQ82402.2 hypothetical protein AWU82_03615 [Pseudomonas glycinae]